MKKTFILICVVFLTGSTLSAQGILFEQGSWEEALAKAKMENKLLFVDVYTSWCGPCKRMSRDVFTREKVGKYYNGNFVSYKLDAEKGVGPEIKKRYGVEAYPTFLFIDGDGKLIYKLVGFYDVKDFLARTEKAAVYARYGGWEQVTEDCNSGRGSSAFWKDLYESAAEEEEQEVLQKYLLSMSDEELFSIPSGRLL